MNIKRLIGPVLVLAGLIAVCPAPARANMMVVHAVTGRVTAAPNGGQISVNGRWYRIRPQSDAAVEVSSVHVGDSVEIRLSGPPTTDSSEVVEIHETGTP